MEVRRRLYGPSYANSGATHYKGLVSPSFRVPSVSTGFERTESEGHPISRLKRGTGEDIGGNFLSQKVSLLTPPRWMSLRDRLSANPNGYDGPMAPVGPPIFAHTGEKVSLSDVQLNALAPKVADSTLLANGTTAIARTIPTNPVFSAAAFLGELREGLPSIPGQKLLKDLSSMDKSIADEFLNFQFAIRPLINDFGKFLKAFNSSNERLDQLYRDSGRMVRRRYTFPVETSTVEVVSPSVYPWTDAYNSASTEKMGVLKTTTTTEIHTWFSGAYTYFFPKQEGFIGRLVELDKRYGVIPDIRDAWQLTPWSWAADWESNLGDLITNVHSFSQDSLVLKYGYIMCHSKRTVVRSWEGELAIGGVFRRQRLDSVTVAETKQRLRATPYGFGLDVGGFSTIQQAIIAALGISKSR